MVKPSIGRIVHYVLTHTEEDYSIPFKPHFKSRWKRGEHCAALIVGVNEDSTVNLHVFLNAPQFEFHNNVPIGTENLPVGIEPGTWHWPERED